ncbi:MAG: zf-HC2 domain-containing protein [Gemmatimonadota bacterium]
MTLFDRLKQLLGGSQAPPSPSGEEKKSSAACKPISCMEAIAKVHEYLDGELDGVSHEEVAHHFSICKKCYPHLRLEERFRELLQRSQEGEACPERLREQVLELLAAEAGESR